jgi:hypothetical protein
MGCQFTGAVIPARQALGRAFWHGDSFLLRWINTPPVSCWQSAACVRKEMVMPPVEWTEALQLDHEPRDCVHREFIGLLAAAERASDVEPASAWISLVDRTAALLAVGDRWGKPAGRLILAGSIG